MGMETIYIKFRLITLTYLLNMHESIFFDTHTIEKNN